VVGEDPSESPRRPGDRVHVEMSYERHEVDCTHAIEQVYSYLDGELTMWKRRAIARHLDDCPPCAHGFTFEIELRQVIVSKCYEEVPEDLKARIARQLGIEP
jgi:mycothiol system anti-sigma-R factor